MPLVEEESRNYESRRTHKCEVFTIGIAGQAIPNASERISGRSVPSPLDVRESEGIAGVAVKKEHIERQTQGNKHASQNQRLRSEASFRVPPVFDQFSDRHVKIRDQCEIPG